LFDLDRTLIAGYSLTAIVKERIRRLDFGLSGLVSHAGLFIDYGLGRTDYHGLLQKTVRDLGGTPESDMRLVARTAFRRFLSGAIYDDARALVDVHRRKGHRLVIVTSATRYQAEPVAETLGIDTFCCTELEVDRGTLTGTIIPPACFGEGKAAVARRLAGEWGMDLERAYFYTDSDDDLPLLEIVGEPRTCNPNPALARIAADRGWRHVDFEHERPSLRHRLGAWAG
jgi:putative phosphoserine phosphatase/1-acylglycerol-3-phosphate O-acyltransferase